MARRKTSDRFDKFAREYIIDMNGTRSAIAAGYSPKGADVRGSQLLGNSRVIELIAKYQERAAKKYEVSAERVLKEISLLGYANARDYVRINEEGQADVDLSNVTRDQFAAIQEITADTTGGSGDGERRLVLRTRIKLASKTANLELLGRHLKLFTDVMEHKGLEGLAEKTAALRARKRVQS